MKRFPFELKALSVSSLKTCAQLITGLITKSATKFPVVALVCYRIVTCGVSSHLTSLVAKDDDILEYDYDSEAEWEDPEEGEELKSDDENDEEDGAEKFAQFCFL